MAAGLMLGFGIGIGGLGVGLMGLVVEFLGIGRAIEILAWIPLLAGLLGLSIRKTGALAVGVDLPVDDEKEH
jgi:FSR family fosmidomycin resistance protein-like MFS transporter